MKQRTFPKIAATAMLCMTAFGAAWGQAAPAPTPTATTELDNVIVTANRRDQLSQKVSGVVQSITADDLRKDGISELRQLQVAVPGLSIANQEGNVEIFIRGVGSANNTELGDPGAAPHINGIYIPRPRGLGGMFYDLERVEVNKGPQGTLYGRNAMAGTLNLITAKPRIGETSGYIQAEFGNRNARGLEGAFNLPLGQTAAMRISGFGSDKDFGFTNASAAVKDTVNTYGAGNNRPAGIEENSGARISLLWTPTDALRVQVMADKGKEAGTGYPGANISSALLSTKGRAEDLNLRDVVYRGSEGKLNSTLDGLQVKVGYDFGSFTADLSASQRKVDFNQRNAASDSLNYPGLDLTKVKFDNFSGQYWQTRSKSDIFEVLLSSNDPKQRLKWTAGAFRFKEAQQVGFLSLADAGYCCYSGTEFTMPDVQGESTALFADGSLDLQPDLRLIAGIRQTTESKSRYGIGGNLALTLGGSTPDNAFNCCFGTRFGTEGFEPNLLDRPNFNVGDLKTPQQLAQYLIESTKTPGLRDTLIAQIQTIANGTNTGGTCIKRSDTDNGFNNCPANGQHSFANLTIPGQQVGSSSANYADFRLGFEKDLSPSHMLYAKVSTGHKSGGFNDSFNGSRIPETYEPESVVVYEAGSRQAFDLMGRRAIFNVTGFAYDYSDQVFQDLACIGTGTDGKCNSYAQVNRNIGKSKIVGLEAEAKFALPNNFGFDLNATLLDTKIESGQVADARGIDYGNGGVSPVISLAGNRLPLASNVNLTARLQQAFALGGGKFDWQALINYRSDYFLTQFNEADFVSIDGATRKSATEAGFPDKQKGYATLNLGIGYGVGDFRVEGFATNVTDVQASVKEIVGPNLNIRFLNDAKAVGMRVRYKF